MRPAFALVWRRDGSPGIVWYIRHLGPSGFYGEVRRQVAEHQEGGCAVGVSHRLSPTDGERVAAILTEFAEVAPLAPGPCFALLGRYTESLGQAVVVCKYDPGSEVVCPLARRFLELHVIVESYLAEAYAQIAEPGAAADGGGM